MLFNPFKVLDLPPTATDEQIEERLNALLTSAGTSADREAALRALHELSDPRRKYIYSLLRMADLHSARSDDDQIEQIYELAEKDPLADIVIADIDNLPVLTLDDVDLREILALDLEPQIPELSSLNKVLDLIPDQEEPPPPSWEEVF